MGIKGFFKAGLIMVIGACAGEGDLIELPPPLKTGEGLEECIERRRSIRSFGDKPLTWEEVSTLLWACQGITDRSRGFRAAPSAGATYPLEVYLVTAEGVFNYRPREHRLTRVKEGDLRRELARAALGQGFVAQAPANFVLAAVPERTTYRYGERGVRYIWIEMGHAAQNLHLQAVALKLGSVPVGAFRDEEVRRLLGLPEGVLVGYIIPVGHPK